MTKLRDHTSRDQRHTVEASVVFVNITNDATPLLFRTGAKNLSSATFGQYQSTVQSPRGAQLLIRHRF
jgi:hypothetical protein